MHKKVWFLVAAAFALLALAGSASAMTRGGSAATKHNKKVLKVAMEQDLSPGCGWNINDTNCNLAWAAWVGWNTTGITYHIKPSAHWNYGGKITPVTGADFIYTVQLLNNPSNAVSSNVGVNQIASAVYNPKKPNVIQFIWKKPGDQALGGGPGSVGCTGSNACGPFADYRDLLGAILPSNALNGVSFTNIFKKCICGANGRYITDGPYYMANYIHGSSVTLKANKKKGAWYGLKPKTPTVLFQVVADTNSELNEIKGLEVDIAAPQPTPAVGDLVGVKGLTVKFTGGAYLEHIDFNNGAGQSNPIISQAYFRKAFMLGLDRQGIINAALPYTKGNLHPLDSLFVFQADSRYKHPFSQWNYNAQAAINLLKANGCTGGPNSPDPNNSNYFTCPEGPATISFTYMVGNSRREASFPIIQADMKAIGIKINPDGQNRTNLFAKVFAENYDSTEFAWGGSIDPGGFIAIWQCNGDSNVGQSCNHTADTYMQDSLNQLNPTQRDIDFINADAALAQSVPAIPLYALPNVTAYNSDVGGVKDNPAAGFTWNMESWYWKK